MKKFYYYISHSKIVSAFEETLNQKQLSAGKDRFTKGNLRSFFSEKRNIEIYHKFLASNYRPRKFMILSSAKIKIVKKNNDKLKGKLRLICKPSIKDRPAFILLKNYLTEKFNAKNKKKLSKNSIIIDIANKLNNIFERKEQEEYFLAKIDVVSFYSNLDREILKNDLKNKYELDDAAINFVKNTIEQYENSIRTVDKDKKEFDSLNSEARLTEFEFLFDYKKGIPQGLPISNILAEMYISGIEKDLKREFMKFSTKISVFRYIDDIIIIFKSKKDESYLKEKIKKMEYKTLTFNDEMDLHRLSDFDWLNEINVIGFNFNYNGLKHNKPIEIGINKDNLSSFINKIEKKFSDFASSNSKTHLAINQSVTSDTIKEKSIIKLISFRNEIDKMITGYFIKDKNGYKGYGWIHYFKDITNPSAFILVDKAIEKFKKRYKIFDNMIFKSALITYRHLKSQTPEGSMYIPNIGILQSIQNEHLLNEFLYNTLLFKFYKIKEMSHSEKIRELNNYLINANSNEKYIDISRGTHLYVKIH